MINEKYSYKDLTDIDLSKEPAKDFGGEIVGSCFFQKDKKKVFPDGIKATFKACNLGNVDLSGSPEVINIGSPNDHVKIENDGNYWIQENNLPKEPRNKAEYIATNTSILPEDIPAIKMDTNIIIKKYDDFYADKIAQIDDIKKTQISIVSK